MLTGRIAVVLSWCPGSRSSGALVLLMLLSVRILLVALLILIVVLILLPLVLSLVVLSLGLAIARGVEASVGI